MGKVLNFIEKAPDISDLIGLERKLTKDEWEIVREAQHYENGIKHWEHLKLFSMSRRAKELFAKELALLTDYDPNEE